MVDSAQCAGWGRLRKNAADMEPDLKRVLNYQNYLKAISTIGTSNHTVIDYLTPQWAGSLEEISSLLDLVMEMEKCKFHIGDVRPFFGCTISIHQVRIVVESLWFSADLLRQASSSHNPSSLVLVSDCETSANWRACKKWVRGVQRGCQRASWSLEGWPRQQALTGTRYPTRTLFLLPEPNCHEFLRSKWDGEPDYCFGGKKFSTYL